jgi:hypothetical protein
MKTLTMMRCALPLLLVLWAQPPAAAWTANDASFVDVAREVTNPPDASADGALYPSQPGMPKNQGIVYAHAQCNLYNTCGGFVSKKVVRTYTKEAGDSNRTFTFSGLAYGYVSFTAGNSATGEGRFAQADGGEWTTKTVTANGSDSTSVSFDKTLIATTLVEIPVYGKGEAARSAGGSAYGYGQGTGTLPNP